MTELKACGNRDKPAGESLVGEETADSRAQLFRRVFEKSTAPSVILEEDLTISMMNEKVEELVGYSRAELEGKMKWTRFVVPEDLERMTHFHHRRRQDPSWAPEEYECRLMDRDGDVYDILIKLNMVQGSTSVATLVNVTSRKEAEKKLKLREDELRGIVENFPGHLYTSYRDYTLEFMNGHLRAQVGREAVGEACYSAIYSRATPCPWCKAADVFKGETVRDEFLNPRDDRWYAAVSTPICAMDGSVRKQQTLLTDITDRKLKEKRLRDSADSLRKENRRLKSTMTARSRFGDLIGKSPEMQAVYEVILNAAASDANIIIYGESGTGKELVSREIHRLSDRMGHGFIPVNCGAIPESLMESEFFGYKKGAFTGAVQDKKGFLDLADGGTLFLDELGEIALGMQAKLLRAIEGNGYTALGGKTVRKPNLRIIAATNRDLTNLITKGLMREDFFYRIHIIPIHLPPLRKRPSDIPLLIDHFLKQYPGATEVPPITPAILDAFQRYRWPGNVRELQNVLHRYVTLKNLDFTEIFSADGAMPSVDKRYRSVSDHGRDLKSVLAETERAHILKTLEEMQWHRGKTAHRLGINRRTLERKMALHRLRSCE
ncbi:sigma 54-interacting transcriptional regulator [Desulfoluna butyratoxydans]|uniref:Pas fold-3 n=1 Tax=Desulfoluna butyratoxydans TaxID=231438 RepID=A0A4U8YT10_9BACT|nr:sigma 54-interacting transcriptional regulator [Desulfoluna butyratoxydans]VFQ47100.1 pas fold-3 [Desulfoluna butyratoxydans]